MKRGLVIPGPVSRFNIASQDDIIKAPESPDLNEGLLF
jgi:hypothetical protein